MRPRVVGALAALVAVTSVAGCESKVDLATGGAGSTSSATSTTSSNGTTSTTGSTSTSSAPTSTSTGVMSRSGCTIVPLYAYPTDGTTWADLATAAAAHPTVEVVAIINPDSGPGTMADPVFADGIAQLKAAGVVVVGYVATNYGDKSKFTINGETDDYEQFYPGLLDGIFFDEMSSDLADVEDYSNIGAHAKGAVGSVTIGNPGTAVAIALLTTMERVVVYENPGLPSLTDVEMATMDAQPDKFALLPYGVGAFDATFVAGARAHARCIYVTDDVEPNPWDSLPPYLDALLASLE